jgi:hypothetical protein
MSVLKPQDLLVLLWLVAHSGEAWSYAGIAAALRMSSAEVHAALKRAARAGLYSHDERRPIRVALREFLVHGARYAFAPERLGLTRGLPTAHAAPALAARLALGADDLPLVWPDAEGEVRGEGLEPLYPSAPTAARHDPRLYNLLALLDALRVGRARERRLAQELLEKELAA